MTIPGTSSSSAAAKAITLRYGEFTTPTGASVESLKWWAAEVEKRTNGRVKVEMYWAGTLNVSYYPSDALKQVKKST